MLAGLRGEHSIAEFCRALPGAQDQRGDAARPEGPLWRSGGAGVAAAKLRPKAKPQPSAAQFCRMNRKLNRVLAGLTLDKTTLWNLPRRRR